MPFDCIMIHCISMAFITSFSAEAVVVHSYINDVHGNKEFASIFCKGIVYIYQELCRLRDNVPADISCITQ